MPCFARNRHGSGPPSARMLFEVLKGEIAARPVSAYPDFSKPFRLYTDASNIGLRAILAQRQNGKEKIICCASRTLNNAESNYSTTKRRVPGHCVGCTGIPTLFDSYAFRDLNRPLRFAMVKINEKHLSDSSHRWAAALEDYRFTILHRPGKLQGHVDALSRLPTQNLAFTLEGKIQST